MFETLPGAYAFRLYRNYDGSGSKFGDVSVTAVSANRAELAIYAAQHTVDGVLTLDQQDRGPADGGRRARRVRARGRRRGLSI